MIIFIIGITTIIIIIIDFILFYFIYFSLKSSLIGLLEKRLKKIKNNQHQLRTVFPYVLLKSFIYFSMIQKYFSLYYCTYVRFLIYRFEIVCAMRERRRTERASLQTLLSSVLCHFLQLQCEIRLFKIFKINEIN